MPSCRSTVFWHTSVVVDGVEYFYGGGIQGGPCQVGGPHIWLTATSILCLMQAQLVLCMALTYTWLAGTTPYGRPVDIIELGYVSHGLRTPHIQRV